MSERDKIRSNIQKGEVGSTPPPPGHMSEEDAAFEKSMLGREINGRFKLKRVIGHGGFGSVFLAHQTSVDRNVAIKILRPTWSNRPQMAQRFLIEAKATSQLQNPHTVTVFDFGKTEDDLLYIAMEYLEGETLQQRLSKNPPLTTAQAVTVASQVAESLAEAHSREIVHRDLKPENVLLLHREEGELFVKVLDFGIARSKAISDELNLTVTGQFSGTPAYMSPEVIRSKTIGPSADVYSLGILLYQMLTGKCPFEGDNPFDVLTQHVSVKPAPLRQLVSTIPVRLDIFVQKCLAKKAQKRPKDAKEFLLELKTIQRTEVLKGSARANKISSRKASPSAATIAVVEETEDAFHFSYNLLRLPRFWVNAHPIPTTIITLGLGVVLGVSTLFFNEFESNARVLLPIKASATHSTPVEESIPKQSNLPTTEKASPTFPIQDNAVDFEYEIQKEDLSAERKDDAEKAATKDLLGSPSIEEPTDFEDEGDESALLEPKRKTTRKPIDPVRIHSKKSRSSQGKSSLSNPKKNQRERDSILLGDKPARVIKGSTVDKVDAFLD